MCLSSLRRRSDGQQDLGRATLVHRRVALGRPLERERAGRLHAWQVLLRSATACERSPPGRSTIRPHRTGWRECLLIGVPAGHPWRRRRARAAGAPSSAGPAAPSERVRRRCRRARRRGRRSTARRRSCRSAPRSVPRRPDTTRRHASSAPRDGSPDGSGRRRRSAMPASLHATRAPVSMSVTSVPVTTTGMP